MVVKKNSKIKVAKSKIAIAGKNVQPQKMDVIDNPSFVPPVAARPQSHLVKTAVFILLALMITTVFIPAVFFKVNLFFGLVPLYTLVFLALTVFAIVKRKLFDIKIITSEPVIIILWVLLIGLTLVTKSLDENLVPLLVLTAVVLFGILLMWNARRDVEQQEKLSALNITLNEANRKLQNLDLARSEFVAMASHQLRTPPSTIKWYLETILAGDYGEVNPEVRDALKKSEITNNSLIALSDELLNVSRIERGTMEFFFEDTSLAELIQSSIDQLLPLANLKKLSLKFVKPNTPAPIVMADRQKFRQVISNLIDNAIKYTKEGSIVVTLSFDDKNITVKVSDTGKGITKDQMKAVFQKFSQGKDLLTRATGMGLGLYLAKIIVTQHKGKIWAESDGLNKGSNFVMTLPIHNGLQDSSFLDLTKNQPN